MIYSFHKTVELKGTDPVSEVVNFTGTSSNNCFITPACANKNRNLPSLWGFVVQKGQDNEEVVMLISFSRIQDKYKRRVEQ
jgi:hypothetical protein